VNRDETFLANGAGIPIMEHDRPRWRFRISTLMLVVIILALASALFVERLNRQQEERRRMAELERVLAEAEQARASAAQAQARFDALARGQAISKQSPGRTGVEGS
jgi:hypothetical protein